MKTLLLDIDYTIAIDHPTNDMQVLLRPHFREFFDKVDAEWNVVFYTAATRKRAVAVTRSMVHQLGMVEGYQKILQRLARKSLSRENAPMIMYKKASGAHIEIKSFDVASEILGIPVGDMIMLDDNPSYDHPRAEQIIQAEGFMDIEEDDDYLLRVLEELEKRK